jgi:hypothetical protein
MPDLSIPAPSEDDLSRDLADHYSEIARGDRFMLNLRALCAIRRAAAAEARAKELEARLANACEECPYCRDEQA